MMKYLCLWAGLTASALWAQNLTRDQKIADLRQLAALYAKNYGPYEWKKEAVGFDLYNLRPWIERAERTRTDLEFLDVLVRYVAALDDAHDVITFPSTWTASLGFSTDIFDGRVLIDSVNRARLPLARFPAVVGDELVSIDGRPALALVEEFRPYAIAANPRSTRRAAAARLTSRPQQLMPLAPVTTPDRSTVVIRRAGGAEETYELDWLKSGEPMVVGPVPLVEGKARTESYEAAWDGDDHLPQELRPFARKFFTSVEPGYHAVLNYGGRSPIFNLPANFQQRLGRVASDVFFSGTYESDGLRIGFIRIPSFSPAQGANFALQQFIAEIAFFQQNTDGLIIDDMRNPGGSVSYCEALLQLIHPTTFRTLGFEIRATSAWIASFSSTLNAVRAAGFPDWQIALWESNLAQIRDANAQNRGRTGPLPLGLLGALDLPSGPIAYTKPIMVVVDEFSASGGDFFPAVVQDNRRGIIFGYRTMGAGGNVAGYGATSYTEGLTRVTESLMNRKEPIATREYPTAPYVENIGVRPDIEVDYMTRENLMTNGAPFVRAMTEAMVRHIRGGR
jgi:hypothetical protein